MNADMQEQPPAILPTLTPVNSKPVFLNSQGNCANKKRAL